MQKTLYKNFKQFIKFSIVGLSNTFVSFFITYGTIFLVNFVFKDIEKGNKILVLVSSLLGFFISVLNSFYWNNKFVFKKTTKSIFKPLLKSYVCYGSIFILAYILNAFVFTRLLHLSHLYIPILQIFICTPLNFLSNKFWAFK